MYIPFVFAENDQEPPRVRSYLAIFVIFLFLMVFLVSSIAVNPTAAAQDSIQPLANEEEAQHTLDTVEEDIDNADATLNELTFQF